MEGQHSVSKIAAFERPPTYDTAIRSHRHTILATAAAVTSNPPAEEGRPVPVTLYHWSPPTVRIILTIIVAPSTFHIIKGFTPLGTFPVTDFLNLSKPLSSLLATDSQPDPSAATTIDHTLTPDLLANLLSQLPNHHPIDDPSNQQHHEQEHQQQQQQTLHFFTFPVLSSSPDALLPEGGHAAWKWSKAESVYPRKIGSWQTDLAKMLEEGEWNAGKGLTVLVKGLGEEVGEGEGEEEFFDLQSRVEYLRRVH